MSEHEPSPPLETTFTEVPQELIDSYEQQGGGSVREEIDEFRQAQPDLYRSVQQWSDELRHAHPHTNPDDVVYVSALVANMIGRQQVIDRTAATELEGSDLDDELAQLALSPDDVTARATAVATTRVNAVRTSHSVLGDQVDLGIVHDLDPAQAQRQAVDNISAQFSVNQPALAEYISGVVGNISADSIARDDMLKYAACVADLFRRQEVGDKMNAVHGFTEFAAKSDVEQIYHVGEPIRDSATADGDKHMADVVHGLRRGMEEQPMRQIVTELVDLLRAQPISESDSRKSTVHFDIDDPNYKNVKARLYDGGLPVSTGSSYLAGLDYLVPAHGDQPTLKHEFILIDRLNGKFDVAAGTTDEHDMVVTPLRLIDERQAQQLLSLYTSFAQASHARRARQMRQSNPDA